MTRPTGTRDGAVSDLPDDPPWKALWALVLGFFMILVDTTIVSVATPALVEAFDSDVTTVMWVTSAYLLAYAVPLLVTGRLGDLVGPKNVYMTGLAVFTGASLWCALAGTVEMLVAARVAQGLGAALMTPQTMTVVTRTFAPEVRGVAMSLWGATAGVAMLVGPVLGGVLLDTAGWRWIFLINVPVGLVGLVLAARLVPRLRPHARTFDPIGVALSALGTFCAVFAIQEGERFGWGQVWGWVSIPLLLGVGVAVLLAFVAWQAWGASAPLVPLGLFRDRNFTASSIGVSAIGFSMSSAMFPLVIYAQTVRGWSPTESALLLVPQALVSILLARWVGRRINLVQNRLLAGPGFVLVACSLVAFWFVMGPTTPVWLLVVPSFLYGLGSVHVWGPMSTSATRRLPLQRAGAGSGVYNTMRQVGSVLGSAGIAWAMDWRVSVHLPGGLDRTTDGTLTGASADAYTRALGEAMLLPAAVSVVGMVAAFLLVGPDSAGRGLLGRGAGAASGPRQRGAR
ncbi:DHA2 family efflux MFS transporter permease subunit [Georgenia sp. Z1491]|uniref:DHA2 family efflux MFS transporter permease subunit n=1 Tax=Georgenia sp. Z1491 TaxID=3416707 RepID=UPI003CECA27F